MIDNPQSFLEEFARSGANRIIVHEEACKDLPSILQSIKRLRVEAGVAINPETPVTKAERVLDIVDSVQVMTVHPGFAGQRFMEDQLSKIQHLRREIDQRHLKTSIVVDGGVDLKTARLAVKSGATVLVAGSSIYNQSASVAKNVAALRSSIAGTVAANPSEA
jgi:ribulose-phosphate 3-epimerase